MRTEHARALPPMQLLFWAAGFVLLLLAGCAAPDSEDPTAETRASESGPDTTEAGLVVMTSPHSIDTTVARLERALEAAGPISIMARVDHAANAETVDRSLRPTRLLVFGNPELGTPLMETSPTTAIDLPQKMLVWEDSTGQVRVAYNDPQYLADRHGITGRDDELQTISGALRKLARRATTAEQ
jgi:uncharacterized protein (DUF302 family)